MTENEFKAKTLKVTEHRVHKVNNSIGVGEAFRFYNKNKPKGKDYSLDSSSYFKIIRSVNNILREYIISGRETVLPEHMGKLELRKRRTSIRIENGKVRNNLPIDWNATLSLWYSDEESRVNKQLIKVETPEVFHVFYNKRRADYPNKTFYKFNINRAIKKGLKESIQNMEIDAPLIYKEHGKDN